MTLQKRPCLCAYRYVILSVKKLIINVAILFELLRYFHSCRILKLSTANFSDQPLNKIHLPNERRKFNLDLTWNRMKVLYQFQEYIKLINMENKNSTKDWINVFRKLPEMFSAEPPKKPFEPTLPPIPEMSETQAQPKKIDDLPECAEVPKSVPEHATRDTKDQSYNIPLISGWRHRNGPPDPSKRNEQIPKWRSNVTVSSPVSFVSRVLFNYR